MRHLIGDGHVAESNCARRQVEAASLKPSVSPPARTAQQLAALELEEHRRLYGAGARQAGSSHIYTAVRASVRVSFTLRSLRLLFRQASSKG